MIGDWYTNIEYTENRQWTIDDYLYTNTEYCAPILLTTEILEKNEDVKDLCTFRDNGRGKNVMR